MSSIVISDTTLRVRLSPVEKVLGLLRDQVVPRNAITAVDVLPDGLSAAGGVRAPGLGLPGRRKLGTWRQQGVKRLVDVRRGQPAVRVRLAGQPYDELLLGSDTAEDVAARLRS